jgi:hypothetical protein
MLQTLNRSSQGFYRFQRELVEKSMTIRRIVLPLAFAAITCAGASVLKAQTANARLSAPAPLAASAPTAVPALVPFSGVALGLDGKPLQPQAQVNFLIFRDEQGGDALWMETQSVPVDPDGQYKVQLGAASSDGLPLDLFSTGEARWLEVQIAGEKPQPRILLASVPYALKAGDATTLGGLPVSAFALAGQSPAVSGGAAAYPGVTPAGVTTTGGTAGYVSEFSGASTIVDSPLFVASGGDVGINETSPTATLDVNGTENVRGALSMPAVATANASNGERSQLLQLSASVWDSATSAAVSPTFELLTYPDGNNTASPSGDFEIHFQQGTTSTRILSIANNGVITFAPTQTFPGTVKSVTATSPLTDLTLNGVTNIGLSTSALETTLNGVYAQLGAADTFTAPITFALSQTFPGTIKSVTATSPLTASTVNGVTSLGLNSFSLEAGLNGVYAQLSADNNTFSGSAAFYGGVTSTENNSSVAAALIGNGTNSVNGVNGSSDYGNGVSGSTVAGYGIYGIATGAGTAGYFTNASTGSTVFATNNASSDATAITGAVSSANSTAISGEASGAGSFALYGLANGNGAVGVVGDVIGGYDSNGDNAYGVSGQATTGTGVFGESGTYSNSFEGLAPYQYSAGMWGDTNVAGGGAVVAAVAGTADNNSAGYFYNKSAEYASIVAYNEYPGPTGLFKTLKASSPDGTCGVGGSGDLSCTGQIKTLVSTGSGTRKVETYAMQSPENWMEDFGFGVLERGVAVVKIDAAFGETVTGDANYHVFLTPKGDSKGLYVINETPTRFEVRESGGGVSSLSFDYRIVAKRRGYEAQRLTDVTESFNAANKRGMEQPVAVSDARFPKKLGTRAVAPTPVRLKPLRAK